MPRNPTAGTGPVGPPPEPKPAPTGPPPGPGRTIAEAATEIGMGYEWLRRKVKARAVRFHQYGRSVRFDDDDMAALRNSHQVEPRPRIARGRRVA